MTDDQEIRISLDGNKWCALCGPNLQEGLSGFGDTPEEALMDLIGQTDDRFAATTASHETIAGALHTALAVLNRTESVCNTILCGGCLADVVCGGYCLIQGIRDDLTERLSQEGS